MWGATPVPSCGAADRAAGRVAVTARGGAAAGQPGGPRGLAAAAPAPAAAAAAASALPNAQRRPLGPAARPGGIPAVGPKGVCPPAGKGQLPRSQGADSSLCQDGSQEVGAFLREIGLSQYTEPLLSNGFDDMDTLLHIEDRDMKDLGILPCHVVKLRRRLQELRAWSGEGGTEFDENNAVVSFLREIGLIQYAEPLLQSGFDELESLMDIEDADMKDLGIPRGHAVKLRRRLLGYQGPQARTQPAAKPSSAPQGACRALSRAPNGTSGSNMPNDEMKTAVERSWERVQALGTFTVGELLYRHTFDLAPEVMDLFPPEVRLKYRDWTADEGIDESNVYESPALRKLFSKFVNAIGCTVAGLHDFSRLVPMLRQLGSRHINYGVREQYWPILGKALIYTLRECLRDSFTSEVEAAWTTVYGFMSNIMIEGLRAAIATRGGCVSAGSDMPALSQKNGGGTDDDCASEDSLTTGLPSECDIHSNDPWNRQTSALTEDALQRQSSGHTDEAEDTNEGAAGGCVA